MKLRNLKIAQFKNLRDFEINFGTQPFTTVLLGQNGTGKSNLLEALIIIFRDLDLGEKPAFTYVLDYECRKHEIHIEADHTRPKRAEQVQIVVTKPSGIQERVTYHRFSQDSERTYLPSYVFGYYSGPSNRMEKHFDQHQTRFYQDQLKGEEELRRPLFYARNIQSQFALLAFFTEEEQPADKPSARQFLRDLLGIEKLVSVYFVVHAPPWTSKDGDPRFWNARGVLGDFLAHLYDAALAPMRRKVRVRAETGGSTTLEHLFCYLRNEQALKKLFDHYHNNQQAFFKALESTYISRVLSEVRIRLKRKDVDEPLTFNDMSEGEQQLLMVLGLLRFTKEDEALFLLDEPDTHLNPAWSVRYFDFMQQAVGDLPTSHVIMTTHNPLVISSLKREDVRIMQRRKTGIFVEQPRENPQGMGVSSILTSEMFGLRTALDVHTQKKLDDQRVLAAKEHLTHEERTRLGELTDELDEMGFNLADDDPVYEAFLKKWMGKEDPAIREQVVLTPEQQREQADMIDRIIEELKAEGRWK